MPRLSILAIDGNAVSVQSHMVIQPSGHAMTQAQHLDAILARLAPGDASVTEVAQPFAMSQPAISKHLSILERAEPDEFMGVRMGQVFALAKEFRNFSIFTCGAPRSSAPFTFSSIATPPRY
jgi:hypothetical protein